MAVFCVIHELNNTKKDYSSFFEAVKSTGIYWGTSPNITFIQSDKQAAFIRDVLASYIATNDKLLVIEVKKHWGGTGFKSNEYDWLKDVIK
jgi:hypothetical protein